MPEPVKSSTIIITKNMRRFEMNATIGEVGRCGFCRINPIASVPYPGGALL